ncbi:RimJ/RimL family protein N-acetyltransferase [Dysgonomonas alginatilytica]|uniref:RimJ/RimL family protein N-acetyltransferase n=1 Tax=Dysgonomonas alginatilytica TaxID=1605892 RepID=A0A2V3PU72_9BACT|nr:GNAT family protein [Dysgonomonas alginatilytica]PXV67450.1 RimJ/RimL family protein N-acetyltransferase [Dysgonomonas alginatilytica]
MKFEAIESVLKNGETIVIREARMNDAEELVAVVKEYVEESEFIPYTQGEFNLTADEEATWIKSLIDSKNSLLLVATYDNRIIGNISLNGAQREMMKHTSCIGIGMLASWRGKGVGSAFFEAAIKWAKENPSIEILWLGTYVTNKNGIALYHKFGFTEIGRHPDFIKLSSDEYVDEITMTLKVANI